MSQPPLVPLPFQRERFLVRWRRRLLSLGGVTLLGALLVAGLPLAIVLGGLHGLVRPGSQLGVLRTYVTATWAAGLEVYGSALLFGAWLAALGDPARLGALTRRVQTHWSSLHVAALRRIFDLRIEAEGVDQIRPRPTIILMRHTSMLDTILPPALLVPAHDTRLRYVLKTELLIDPCLDIAGNRIPNLFVRRGAKGDAAQRELDHMGQLAATMEGTTAVVLFPEGTRATLEKRERAIDTLERADDPRLHNLLTAARRLHHLMPLRLGGAMSLLRGKPDADVVFVAHVGFDELTGYSALTGGKLVRRTVHVRFWRSVIAPPPDDGDALERWLLDRWQEVDDAVGEMKG